MPLPQPPSFRLFTLLILLALLAPARIFAVTCTMQAEMTDDQRNALLQASRKLALDIQGGDSAAVRSLTLPNVAAQFDPIANTIRRIAPMMTGASITIDAMFGLDASDLKSTQDQTQFFCDSPKSNLHTDITIPGLPPGKYALALVHATGVARPQQIALLLASNNGAWQLGGFFVRPMLLAGHDSVWYWTKARAYAQKAQNWNAHFYYEIAVYLASPVAFLNTPNLEKLLKEQADIKAEDLPGEKPLAISAANGEVFSITNMHTDDSLGGLDLVISYTAADTSDPVATRTHILDLMKALLAQHPELRDAFHGLWVFANAPGRPPFGIEQPMSDLH